MIGIDPISGLAVSQNDNEDIGIVNQEDLRDSSQRIKNSEHEKNVHTNQVCI